MYKVETGTAKAECGTEVGITVLHVDIDPDVAREVFGRGVETGSWGWKHKVWACVTLAELRQIQAVARYYYGWAEGSEKVTRSSDGGYVYEASYAC